MSYNCLLSDMIVRIKNSQLVKKKYVIVNFSNLIESVCKLLMKIGYISKFEKVVIGKNIFKVKIFLKYTGVLFVPAIKEFTLISKPGRRIFISYKRIDNLCSKLGIVIVSTSAGILTKSRAKHLKLGGEVLFNIF